MLCLLIIAQVCDEPHPLLVKEMLQHCVDTNIDEAYKVGLLPLSPWCLESLQSGGGARGSSGLFDTPLTPKITEFQIETCFAHHSARTSQKAAPQRPPLLGPAWQEGRMSSWWWEHVPLLVFNMHEYFAFMESAHHMCLWRPWSPEEGIQSPRLELKL